MSGIACIGVLVTLVFMVLMIPGGHSRIANGSGGYSNSKIWTYECTDNRCKRRHLNAGETATTLETCNMLCSYPSLWPRPRWLRFDNRSASTFKKDSIKLNINSPECVNNDLKQAFNIFLSNLAEIENFKLQDVDLTNVIVNVDVTEEDDTPKLATNESYTLVVEKLLDYAVANITAKTYFGARHGLETLSQLIWLDSSTQKLQIYNGISIKDSPDFPHRGLMVDTARNFFPIQQLLRVVDGMSANKFNVFHWHITDAKSFPLVLPSNPWMATYGAYSPDKVYRPEEIRNLIEYSRIRGIRVILEVDSPSHVNEGWNHANRGDDKVIICGEDDVDGGQLNPDNNRSFELLESVYSDLLQLGTDRETFHVGGDEVNLDCYSNTLAARSHVDKYEFWADLNNKIFETATKAFANNPPDNLVIWSSDLTDKVMSYLKYSKNLVVQFWYGKIKPILKNGNKVIFSSVGKWYLDCGFGPWKSTNNLGNCDPYTHWKVFYTYRPWYEYKANKNQVLGGEACLWTEQVDVYSLETRIWPRAAAVAERLWSDIPHFDQYDVSTRISSQRDRLISRGFEAAAIWPEWCTKNPGKC